MSKDTWLAKVKPTDDLILPRDPPTGSRRSGAYCGRRVQLAFRSRRPVVWHRRRCLANQNLERGIFFSEKFHT
jgi:hypothetical protein